MKNKKTICLNMIVKDESHVIRRCLESVKHLIDYWVIVDTGSTDGTQQIIRDSMQGIPGELHERPWVNFEHNRNQALDLARGKANYFLFIDADDRLVFSPSFTMPDLDKDFYLVQQHMVTQGGSYHPVLLMIKDFPFLKWEGAVHEAIPLDITMPNELLEGVTNEYLHDGARSKDPDCYKKDAEMLKAAIEKDPENRSRNMYYLGQTYSNAKDYHAAIECFEKRAAIGSSTFKARLNNYEVYLSLFYTAKLRELVAAPKDVILKTYSRAFISRPTRVEPLFEMARIFLETGNYFMAYLIAQQGLDTPAPVDVYTQNEIYEWKLRYCFSVCALECCQYREAYNSIQKLLANPQLPENLRQYIEHDLPQLEKLV